MPDDLDEIGVSAAEAALEREWNKTGSTLAAGTVAAVRAYLAATRRAPVAVTREEVARLACHAMDVHLECVFPDCGCKTMGAAADAILALLHERGILPPETAP